MTARCQVERTSATITIIRPYIVHDDAGIILAITTHPELADRIATLIDRHGITDTPNNIAELDQ
jgi:Trk K+ transport system NAD-binding subunit